MTSGVHRLARIIAILLLATMVVACGDTPDSKPTGTPEPTATAASAPAEEPRQGDGIVRTAWNKSGDAGNWVWDRVSGAGNWIWGGVSGGGSWLWNRVSGLPGETADLFAGIWRWIKGSSFGEAARQTVVTARTVAAAVSGFSLSGLLWRLVRYALYAVLALIVVWLLVSRIVLPFVGGLPGRVMRTAGQSVQRGRQAEQQRHRTVTAGAGKRPASHDRSVITIGDIPPEGTAPRDLRWTKAQIRELRRIAANPTIVALFELTRSSDGEPVNYRELIDVTGRSTTQVRADFVAFSEACRAIHHDDVWPVNLVPATDGSSRTAYVVEGRYLDWWFER